MIDMKDELDKKDYIVSAIVSYKRGTSLEKFFPNADIKKIENIINSSESLSQKNIEEIENLVF